MPSIATREVGGATSVEVHEAPEARARRPVVWASGIGRHELEPFAGRGATCAIGLMEHAPGSRGGVP